MPDTERLTTREFLREVRHHALAKLDGAFGEPQERIIFSSLQIHFGEPRMHYEVWPVRKTARLEIGLHLEGPGDWSRALAVRLASHADDLRRGLGPAYELEDWTASWCRLHQSLPLDVLTSSFALTVAGHLVRLIRQVEPLVRSLDVAPPPPSAGRPPIHRRRRRPQR